MTHDFYIDRMRVLDAFFFQKYPYCIGGLSNMNSGVVSLGKRTLVRIFNRKTFEKENELNRYTAVSIWQTTTRTA